MSIELSVRYDPSKILLNELASKTPVNPFYTLSYVEARCKMGSRSLILSFLQDDKLFLLCTGFIKVRLFRKLEITSMPIIEFSEPFWEGLINFCNGTNISQLEINSYGSASINIPVLPGEISRRMRYEYILELQDSDLWKKLSSNHIRNIKLARKANIKVRKSTDLISCIEHARLVTASLKRQRIHGKQIPGRVNLHSFLPYIQSKSGIIFQAIAENKVLSSIMVLIADKGAYYHSAGTSEEGMACGSSHFLVYEIAKILKKESKKLFNLGGTDETAPGLQRFKIGFGAKIIKLESAEFILGNKFKNKFVKAIRLLRFSPLLFFRRLLIQKEQFLVYSADPQLITSANSLPGVMLAKLSDQTLVDMSERFDELKFEGQRFLKLRFNDAYGLYVDGALAHIAWLITTEHDQLLSKRNVKLNFNEAEITHCYTLTKYRGKGLYTHAIYRLCELAREKNIKKVYMITNVNNIISKRAIEKCEFKYGGRISQFRFPILLGGLEIIFRGHR